MEFCVYFRRDSRNTTLIINDSAAFPACNQWSAARGHVRLRAILMLSSVVEEMSRCVIPKLSLQSSETLYLSCIFWLNTNIWVQRKMCLITFQKRQKYPKEDIRDSDNENTNLDWYQLKRFVRFKNSWDINSVNPTHSDYSFAVTRRWYNLSGFPSDTRLLSEEQRFDSPVCSSFQSNESQIASWAADRCVSVRENELVSILMGKLAPLLRVVCEWVKVVVVLVRGLESFFSPLTFIKWWCWSYVPVNRGRL